MNTDFDPLRSEAIRAGLIAGAAAGRKNWRPWRGLALVLAGVLAGTGATTAAFANGRVPATPPPSPGDTTDGQQSSSAGLDYVIVEGGTPLTFLENDTGDEVGAEGLALARSMRYAVTFDPKTHKVHVEYQPTKDLREVGSVEFVLAEGAVLDLSAHPSEASLASVTITCHSGGISVAGPLANDDGEDVGEDSDDENAATGDDSEDTAGPGTITTQAMIWLDRPQRHLQPVDGCAAEVAVTYYAES